MHHQVAHVPLNWPMPLTHPSHPDTPGEQNASGRPPHGRFGIARWAERLAVYTYFYHLVVHSTEMASGHFS